MKRNVLADTYTSSTVNSCSSSSDVWLLTAVAVICDLIYSLHLQIPVFHQLCARFAKNLKSVCAASPGVEVCGVVMWWGVMGWCDKSHPTPGNG